MNPTPFALGRSLQSLSGCERRPSAAVYRYVKLNPVRAATVATPADRWSIHAANAQRQPDPLLTPHSRYLAIGLDEASRLSAYRAWVADAVSPRNWS